jgi:hypothetical protein
MRKVILSMMVSLDGYTEGQVMISAGITGTMKCRTT